MPRVFGAIGILLAAAAGVVTAGKHHNIQEYKLIPDQEGQYPRLGACPDPHACIFPPDL